MKTIKKLLALTSAIFVISANTVFAETLETTTEPGVERANSVVENAEGVVTEGIELLPELEYTEEELEEMIELFLAEEKEKALESDYRFKDVNESSVYFEPVMFLYENNVVSGYDYDYFRPWNWVNRAEMVKVIVEAAAPRLAYEMGVEDPLAGYENENCFSDVQAGEWYTKYICFAADQGWVNGYDDGSFKPGQYVTFVEGLKISFMGFAIDYVETEGLWYKDAIARAYQYVYIPETVGTKYEKYMNRGELAYLIRMQLVFDPKAISELATWNFAAWVELNF